MGVKTGRILLVTWLILSISLMGCSSPATNTKTNSDVETKQAEKVSSPRDGGTLTVQLSSEPVSLDPAHLYENSAIEVGLNIYNGLLKYNRETLKPEGDIAKNWDISADGLTYIFHLRQDVSFHNGHPVDAETFKYSFERLADPQTASELAYLLEPVLGATEKMSGSAQTIKGIKVVDSHTLTITLAQPNTSFILALTHPALAVVDKTEVEKQGKDYGASKGNIVGTGAFKLADWQSTDRIELVKNKEYFMQEDQPRLDKVVFKVLRNENTAMLEYQAGNLDVMFNPPPGQTKTIKQDTVKAELLTVTPSLSVYFYGFNLHQSPLDNSKIRQAINYAIDREVIAETVLEGNATPAKGIIPPGLPGYNKDLAGYSYNPSKAKSLLTEAGFPEGKDLPPITLAYAKNLQHEKVAEVLKAQLAEVGIKVNIDGMETGAFRDGLFNGKLQTFRLDWVADYPEADNFLYPLYYSKNIGATNFEGYTNKEVDRMLDEARITSDLDERSKKYQQIEETILEDAPMLWLFHSQTVVLRQSHVKGLVLDSLGHINLNNIWLDQ